jgi:hypothetical protein
MMHYAMQITWNGKAIVAGKFSAVMAWENLRIGAQQYSAAERAGFSVPTLVDMANAKPNDVFIGRGDDGTGVLEYKAVCVEGAMPKVPMFNLVDPGEMF